MTGNNNIEIKWNGPYSFFQDPINTFFDNVSAAEHSGIYLLTFEYKKEYLINYVGIASNKSSIKERLLQHLQAFLAGKYWIYEPEHLRNGIKKSYFEKPPLTISSKNQFLEHCTKVYDHLMMYNIFLSPLDLEVYKLKTIESTIYFVLKNHMNSKIQEFFDNVKPSISESKIERVELIHKCPLRLLGLN